VAPTARAGATPACLPGARSEGKESEGREVQAQGTSATNQKGMNQRLSTGTFATSSRPTATSRGRPARRSEVRAEARTYFEGPALGRSRRFPPSARVATTYPRPATWAIYAAPASTWSAVNVLGMHGGAAQGPPGFDKMAGRTVPRPSSSCTAEGPRNYRGRTRSSAPRSPRIQCDIQRLKFARRRWSSPGSRRRQRPCRLYEGRRQRLQSPCGGPVRARDSAALRTSPCSANPDGRGRLQRRPRPPFQAGPAGGQGPSRRGLHPHQPTQTLADNARRRAELAKEGGLRESRR